MTLANREARPVAFRGHISSLQTSSMTRQEPLDKWSHLWDIERNYGLCQDRSAVRRGEEVSLPLTRPLEAFDRVWCLIHAIVLA